MERTEDNGMPPLPPERWPRWVYGAGQDPEPRQSRANRRASAAQLATAAGVGGLGPALHLLGQSNSLGGVERPLVAAALAAAIVVGVRWASTERTLRIRAFVVASTPRSDNG
ncbi:hypothetical protein GCM10023349_04320 [Nocardioides conyzicola]|uniref:Uncharacterized protein n=1 Tax=Nocardioides conyzicola TaxID=1651781 RepID=A0ABP8WPE5_9ACTN